MNDVGRQLRRRNGVGRTQVAAGTNPGKAEIGVIDERLLQMIEKRPQVAHRNAIAERMQAKVVQPRFQVNRVRRGDPHRGPVSCLPPHPQCTKPLFRLRQIEDAEDAGQQLLGFCCLGQIRTRQPAPQRRALQPPATDSRQKYDSGCFFIRKAQGLLNYTGFV